MSAVAGKKSATVAEPRSSSGQPALPPGPRLPRVVQTYLYTNRTVSFLQWCRRKYGPCFTARLLLFGDVVFVSDPEMIKEVVSGDPALFHGGETNSFLEPVVGPRSLFILDEKDHLDMRRVMLPAFHGERLRLYPSIVKEITEREIERWPVGRAFQLRPHLERISMQVMLEAVFGVRDDKRLSQLQEKVPALFRINPVLLWVRAFRADFGRWSPWARFARKQAEVDEIFMEEIRSRRSGADPSGQGGDMLGALLEARNEEGQPLSDAEIRDQLITVLSAGYEPPTTAMSWLFERLLRHPAALERLRSEVLAGEDAYLDAVVKETLRARPVVVDFGRTLTAPAQIGNYLMPAGTVVTPSVVLTHLAEEIHSEPERFQPERFLDEGRDGSGFIPFGGGVRRCLGASVAMVEIKTVVKTVIRRLELQPAREEAEVWKLAHVTLRPSRGAEVLITNRAPSESPEPAVR